MVAALLLPVALYLLLQPESYGPSVNRLDGWFYTGYAVNFDDIMPAISDSHYFVSRWALYMPSRIFSQAFGPEVGRLLLRWLVASAMLLCLWMLGRRWRWNAATEIVAGTVVISSPMFARAFFTDYFEWVAASVGFIVVCHALSEARWPRTVGLGMLAAVVVIANPTAATVVAAPLAVYLLRLGRRRWGAAIAHAGVLAAAGAAVLVAGLLLFRWRYGIDNVYAPTVEFVRANTDYQEPLRSPTLTWMQAYVWIYGPAALTLFALLIKPIRDLLRTDRIAVAAFVLMLIQYAYQFADQFIRMFVGLEIEYYWALVYPTFLVVTAICLGRVRWTLAGSVTFVALWLGSLLALSHLDLNVPGRVFLLAAAVAAIVLAAVAATRRPEPTWFAATAVAALQLGLLATQIAPPSYTPPPSHRFDLRPYFEDVYLNADSPDVQRFRDALFLVEELDKIRDRDLSFLVGQSDGVGALYGGHVTGRMVYRDAEGRPTADAVAYLRASRGRILLMGSPEELRSTITTLRDSGLPGRVDWRSPETPGTGIVAWRYAVAAS